MRKKPGRPTKDTPEVRRRIEEAAALDASVEEIAFYAGIHRDTLHEILTHDPSFSDRIRELRQTPVIVARQRVVKGIHESYANAVDYLKRKKKAEFGDSSSVEITSPIPIYGGGSLQGHDGNAQGILPTKAD